MRTIEVSLDVGRKNVGDTWLWAFVTNDIVNTIFFLLVKLDFEPLDKDNKYKILVSFTLVEHKCCIKINYCYKDFCCCIRCND